jgi:hypothetical protein
MNERERILLYEMIKLARGKLIQICSHDQKDKFIVLGDLLSEASRILGTIEEIYSTPDKNHDAK